MSLKITTATTPTLRKNTAMATRQQIWRIDTLTDKFGSYWKKQQPRSSFQGSLFSIIFPDNPNWLAVEDLTLRMAQKAIAWMVQPDAIDKYHEACAKINSRIKVIN
jgi:hypothetical protein